MNEVEEFSVVTDKLQSFELDVRGVTIIDVPKLGKAASLRQPFSWIDVDEGMKTWPYQGDTLSVKK